MVGQIEAIFGGAADFCRREVRAGGLTLTALFLDGMTSGSEIAELILRPLAEHLRADTAEAGYEQARHMVWCAVCEEADSPEAAADKLVHGYCAVCFPGLAKALCFEVKSGTRRGPSAPETENTVKGAKDAFTETVRTNTSLLRRHLRTPALRLYETQVGRRSLTNVTVAYIDGLTDPSLVTRMKRRLTEIDIDGMLTPSSVEEYVTGSRPTAFPLLQYTERTDRFAQGLLDGRIGLLIDGLPLGYLAPVDLGYLMSSAEDRGTNYISASCLRLIRYLALLIGLLLPAFYVAMAAFHPEMLPTPLLGSIIESKQSVPFPTVFEVLGLLVAFELLQEASVSLPQSIGQSLSIIGGIVVGSAAVEAKILSPAALIIVATAGICGFAMPGRGFADALRLWRFLLAVLASLGGLFGLTLGALCLLVHLAGLESLGVPYLAPFARVSGMQTVLRTRLKNQKYRDAALKPLDRKNQN